MILEANGLHGLPGDALETWQMRDLPAQGSPAISALSSTTKVVLSAGQKYWLEVRGMAPNTMDLWLANNRGIGGGYQNINQAGWTPLSGPGNPFGAQTLPAFQISGTPVSGLLPMSFPGTRLFRSQEGLR